MQKIKGLLAFILTLALGLALFVVFIKQVGIGNVLLELGNIQFEWILLALVIFMAIFIVDAWRWKIILNGEGFLARFRYILVARFAWFAISFIVPIFYVVGEGFRAYILKKTSGIAITDSMRTIIIDKVVEILMLLILLIVGGILLLLNFDTSFLTTISWIMIIVGALGLVVFYWQVTSGKSIFR
ncbi:MAG: flippase-like domain-containing protein, partial [Patescibacteria group bacterium]